MRDLLKIMARPYKRKYLPYAILAIIFMMFDVGIALVIPRITKDIFTEINKPSGSIDKVIYIGVIVISIAIFAVVTTILNNVFAQYLSTKIVAEIRSELFEKIQKLSFSNIDSITSGKLMTIVTSDTNQIQQIIMMSFRAILRSPLTLVGAMIMAYTTNASMFYIILIAAPLLGIIIWIILQNATKTFTNVQKALDELNEKLHETVSGAREIKSFVSELEEIEKFDVVNNNYRDAHIRVHRLMSLLDPTIILISNIAISAVLYIGARIAFNNGGGKVDPELVGTISAYIAYLQQIIMSLMMLSMIAMVISRSEVSAKRISLVLNTEVNIVNPEDPITLMAEGEVEFKDVSFGYTEEGSTGLTLKDLSFKIPAKSTVGIIGSTGSGKTSLVQLLPRLYDVSSGEVLIDGVNVKDYDLNFLRSQISYVTQEAIIFSGTIESNIRQGKEDATIEELTKAARLAVADEYIEKFDLQYAHVVNQQGANLSGGQKQRLSLARALVRNPKILILDDFTSAVDAKSEDLIKSNVAKTKNQTTLIIAQKISSIIDCDYIIVIGNDGTLDGFGPHEEIIKTSKVYQEIYASQIGGNYE